ncbi:MAG: hypothetical protein GY856_31645 [bacterium]|nr:hypothetical protein [bacterium]
MKLDTILGIARAEARSVRRLVRYWVFASLATGIGIIAFLYYGTIHGLFSSYSATVGFTSPRYLVGLIGLYYLIAFLAGLILLSFDVRARDQRERIAEVLDSQPCTNLELVIGRFLGILVPAWLPVLVAVALMEVIGWLGQTLRWPIGELVEPWTALRFVFLMAVPAFAFTIALVFVISLLVRNRFLTALMAGGLIAATEWVVLSMPVDRGWMFDLLGLSGSAPGSDLVRVLGAPEELVQRLAVLVAACGLLALAAAVHPRHDGGSRPVRVAAGVALVAVGLVVLGGLRYQSEGARTRFDRWHATHEARRDEPVPDLEAITGVVTVDPGRALRLELALDLAAPPETALEAALFTLNPGLAVEQIRDRSDRELAFSHRDGLLEVTLGDPLPAGERTSLTMTLAGRPETTFAFLDAAIDPMRLEMVDTMIFMLGIEPAIFERRFVTLMPAMRWLPAPGAEVGRGDPTRRAVDFFRLDLTVDLPQGWLAAGPGRRREAAGAAAGRVRYRFAPPAPLPEAAVIASRFERRAAVVEGVEFEILVHPAHTRNLEVLAEAGDEIRSWLGERLREAAELGLPYPYEALTLVEVPLQLRGFGGGWRMDTTFAPPAMVLMRETGFPTTRFDNRFRNREDFADREGGIARAMRESLEEYFAADFGGGNPLLGAARNFFQYQTAARGPGALGMDFVAQDLTNRLITGRQGYFSVYVFNLDDFGGTIARTLTDHLPRRSRGRTVAESVFAAATDRPEIWEQAGGVALAAIDPWEDPARTIDVLALKGDAMSRSILDGLGRRKAGELLAALRSRTAGETFDRDDLVAAAAAAEVDLEALIGDWIDEAALPGFIASPARLFRLPDTADGTPQYQLALHVRNDEPAPGLLRLAYRPGGAEDLPSQYSEPVKVGAEAAVEIGLVLSHPPRRAWIDSYFSLNRHSFRIALPELDEEKIVDAESLRGTRPSDWAPQASAAIVVDDLDPGFRVEDGTGRSGLRLGAQGRSGGLDQGLPVSGINRRPAPVWQRWVIGSRFLAWGKYRHTLAAIRAGRGDRRAVFTAELPHAGRWRLELFMPQADGQRGPWRRGTYHLSVLDSAGTQNEIAFDADGSEVEWNVLGEIELPAGEVRVELSDKTDGGAVIADAIRWLPLTGAEVTQEEKNDA